MQAKESASRGMLAVKDAYIAALCTELRGRDRVLQAKCMCIYPYLLHVYTLTLSILTVHVVGVKAA